jgi:hypothetical protein
MNEPHVTTVLYCVLHEVDGSRQDTAAEIRHLHRLIEDDLRIHPIGMLVRPTTDTSDLLLLDTVQVRCVGDAISMGSGDVQTTFGMMLYFDSEDGEAGQVVAQIIAYMAQGLMAVSYLFYPADYEFDPDTDISFDCDPAGHQRSCYTFPFPMAVINGTFSLLEEEEPDEDSC